MIEIDLVPTDAAVKSNFYEGAIRYITQDGEEKPLVRFDMQTYEKVSRINSEKEGRSILSPVNEFFKQLTDEEQSKLYDYYATMRRLVDEMGRKNISDPNIRAKLIERMRSATERTFQRIDCVNRLMTFTTTDYFIYPDLTSAGKDPHHSEKKTFLEKEYAELTAMSLFCKIMSPIWGAMVVVLEQSNLNSVYKEYFTHQIVEGVLTHSGFENIYDRFWYYAETLVNKQLKENDARKTGSAISSFILSRSKMTADDFLDIVVATVIVKKLVRYDCIQKLQDGSPPNMMVYVDREIKEIVEAGLSSLRKKIRELPQREAPTRGGEENNTSIIDHISKLSQKTADIPVYVAVMAEKYDQYILLEKSGVNRDHWEKLSEYYNRNPFPVNPLTISIMSSFIGKQIKGSRLIDYFPFRLIARFTAMLQLYLAQKGLINIVPYLSCMKPDVPNETTLSLTASRILASYQTSAEYEACKKIFRGYSEKTIFNPNDRGKPQVQRISFEDQITRLVSWMVEEQHLCNVPGWFWEHYPITSDPIVNKDCPIDEILPIELYQFYLMFHSGDRQF